MSTRRQFLAGAGALLSAACSAGLVSAHDTGTAAPFTTTRLNNGVDMPMIGFGTYRTFDETANAVDTALRSGYRLVDTAAYYKNEVQVGEGIARSEVPRRHLFIASKLWMADYGYDSALRAFDESVRRLRLEYLDAYFLHYPAPRHFDTTLAAYRAMERLLREGRIRAIGVSNFGSGDLQRLRQETNVVPAINQVEVHPYFNQLPLREENRRLGILTQAWSPLGGIYINHPKDPSGVIHLLRDPQLVAIATKYARSPAQIVLRWHVQNGVAVIPKSIHAARIRENFEIFDFRLAQEDMAAINGLNRDLRGGTDPAIFDMDLIRSRG